MSSLLRSAALWGSDSIAERTRGRTVILHQLAIGMIALFATMVSLAMGSLGQLGLLLGGLLLIFLLTATVIAVPWQNIHPLWSLLLPLGDIVAIVLMRVSNPSVGFSLLWIFPALWLAGSFGLVGVVGANVLINGLYWFSAAVDDAQGLTPTVILIPLMIGTVTVTSYIAARRTAFQRELLASQARQLARSAQESRRQEATLVEVLDSVDFGVIRIEANGEETLHNEAHAQMQQLLGHDEQHPKLYAADGWTELAPAETPLARARRGETFERELVWSGSPGTGRRALSVISRALEGPNGARAGGILVSLDVTEEVMALRAREDLVSSVSHELRTPLTSILGYLELVLDADGLPERAGKRIEIAKRNATRLLTIVNDVLTRATPGVDDIRLSIAPQSSRIDDIVTAAVEGLQTPIDERRMTVDTTAIERVTAHVDPLRIRQVVDNLLGNALKYGRRGGKIDVGVTSDGDDAWIVVRDDGPGIAPDELPKLFDRFFRSDTVRHTSTHGSGLGLSICRDIVRGHGGEISALSNPGEGATFMVRLPLRRSEGIPE